MLFSSFGSSSSSFFFLGIVLVIIGILGYLISRKFQEQNHKITTMCELVATMAQDLQMLKMQNAVDKIQQTLQSQPSGVVVGGSGNLTPYSSASNVASSNEPIMVDILGYDMQEMDKIVVSDDEGSYDDSEDDNSTLEEFEEEVEDLDDDIEITESFEPNDTPEVDVEFFMDDNVETKHIDLSVDSSLGDYHDSASHSEPVSHIFVNKLESSPSPVLFSLDEQVTEPEPEPLEVTSILETPTELINTTPATKPKKQRASRSVSAEESELMENLEDFNGDYSKLNVTQLRKLVTDKGLSTHATKLKKTELLQLLGSGNGSVGVIELDGLDIL